MRLKTKVALSLLPVVLLPFLAIYYFFNQMLGSVYQEKTLEQVEQAVTQAQTDYHVRVSKGLTTINMLAKLPELSNFLRHQAEHLSENPSYQPLLELLLSLVNSDTHLSEIAVYDQSNEKRISTSFAIETSSRERYARRQKMFNAEEYPYIETFRDEVSDEIYTMLVAPIFSSNQQGQHHQLRGYVVVKLLLTSWLKEIKSKRIGQLGYMFAASNTGESYTPQQTAERLPAAFILSRFTDFNETKPIEHGKKKTFVHVSHLNDNLNIAAAWPESEVIELTRRGSVALGAMIVVGVFLLTVVLFLILNKHILKRLEKLRDATQKVGSGQFDIDLEHQFDDEIGELAESLMQMSGNLLELDDKLRQIAYHDELTGLPNRAMFFYSIEKSLQQAKRHQSSLALLFIDLDGFKEVNDTLGHDAGDIILKEVSQRLVKCLRESDVVGVSSSPSVEDMHSPISRLGGDEFTVLLDKTEGPEDGVAVAQRILDSLKSPFFVFDHEFTLGASIGITTYPEDANEPAELLKNADLAMYSAKENGKNTYRYFNTSMTDIAMTHHQINRELRHAIANDELVLYYQPQMTAKNGKIRSCEALIRWQHPIRGFMPPGEFVPVAEKTGLIVAMGEWALKEACVQAKSWYDTGLRDFKVAVNVSSLQFIDNELDEQVASILKETGLPAAYLELEFTETAMMQSNEVTMAKLDELKRLGISMAMDDFGTGYSSLAYLKDLPIDKLKIDKRFIDDIEKDERGRAIVRGILAMAQQLDLKVTAEGVETAAQLEFLREKDCTYIQGYYISRPIPEHEFTELLYESNPQIRQVQ